MNEATRAETTETKMQSINTIKDEINEKTPTADQQLLSLHTHSLTQRRFTVALRSALNSAISVRTVGTRVGSGSERATPDAASACRRAGMADERERERGAQAQKIRAIKCKNFSCSFSYVTRRLYST